MANDNMKTPLTHANEEGTPVVVCTVYQLKAEDCEALRRMYAGTAEKTSENAEEPEIQKGCSGEENQFVADTTEATEKKEIPSNQATYPNNWNPPKRRAHVFNTDEVINKLNELISEVMNPDNEPDQSRGRVRDIYNVALEIGTDNLADMCESFTAGDATREMVVNATSDVLAEIAAEKRKMRLVEAWKQFCEEQHTDASEMYEIIANLDVT